ncbi:hypothetical protein THARTR1_09806 [Trichoderma harzianum]|uniref:Uncharacterized protein n=1 Tax=Trichoderma harzianum TaxID=5544 RepID=A0A2K0TVC3_TRIHA|nr:hypothetical protein THARTR1_09806 [Trichoderma harzianum]
MLRFLVPERDSVYPSRDSRFRRFFNQPLQKNPPRLTKEGYIRALELYGREDNLLESLKGSVARFNQWRRDNPGDLAEYRRYANERGYDWENGSVDNHSFYTSYIRAESTEVSQENPTSPSTTPQTAATGSVDATEVSWVEFPQPQEAYPVEEEHMTAGKRQRVFIAMKRQQHNNTPTGQERVTRPQAPPSRSASSSTGRNRRQAIVVEDQERPYLLQGAIGNMVWKDGETEANAAGVAYIATAAMNALRHVVQNKGRIEGRDLEIAQGLVDYISVEDMDQFCIQLGNVVQGGNPSGGLRNSWLEEEQEAAPLATEDESDPEDAGRVGGNAREQAELPYILEDCWDIAGESIPVSVLYANGQALPLRDSNVAKLLGKFHEAVIKEGRMNVTLAKSMNMLGIPAAAILRTDPAITYLTGEGAAKALDAFRKCTCDELVRPSATKKLVLAAVEFYDKHGYTQISKRMPALF